MSYLHSAPVNFLLFLFAKPTLHPSLGGSFLFLFPWPNSHYPQLMNTLSECPQVLAGKNPLTLLINYSSPAANECATFCHAEAEVVQRFPLIKIHNISRKQRASISAHPLKAAALCMSCVSPLLLILNRDTSAQCFSVMWVFVGFHPHSHFYICLCVAGVLIDH